MSESWKLGQWSFLCSEYSGNCSIEQSPLWWQWFTAYIISERLVSLVHLSDFLSLLSFPLPSRRECYNSDKRVTEPSEKVFERWHLTCQISIPLWRRATERASMLSWLHINCIKLIMPTCYKNSKYVICSFIYINTAHSEKTAWVKWRIQEKNVSFVKGVLKDLALCLKKQLSFIHVRNRKKNGANYFSILSIDIISLLLTTSFSYEWIGFGELETSHVEVCFVQDTKTQRHFNNQNPENLNPVVCYAQW